MKTVTTLALTAALAFVTMAPAFAQQPRPCAGGQHVCETAHKAPVKSKTKISPRVGNSARNGAPFVRSANSRVAAPPKGHEYRVVKDYLVVSDTRSKKIQRIVGPVSEYQGGAARQ